MRLKGLTFLLLGTLVCFLIPARAEDAFDKAARNVDLLCSPFPFCAWKQLRKEFAPVSEIKGPIIASNSITPEATTVKPIDLTTTPSSQSKKCTKKCVCGTAHSDSAAFLKAITKNKQNIGPKEQYAYYPWIVRVIKVVRTSPKVMSVDTMCAGTLMNKQYILTAASCVHEWQNKPKEMAVSIGGGKKSPRLELQEDDGFLAVTKILVHPQFNPATFDNNIALIQLKRTLKKPNIVPICLPSKKARKSTPTKALSISWGKQSGPGIVTPKKLVVDKTKLILAKQCRDASKYYYANITDNMVCSQLNILEPITACQSESGGPLVIRGKNKRYGIHGVATWTNGCGAFGTPGIYADVVQYVDWMKEVMKTKCVTCL